MRDRRDIAFFRNALFLVLATPACGTKTELLLGSGSSGLGPDDASTQAPDAISNVNGIPQTPCDWSLKVRSPCSWQYSFAGDPVACTGFPGEGTPAQCAAVCGNNPEGIAADTCVTGYEVQGGGYLDCSVHTGSTCDPGHGGSSSSGCCNGGRRTDYFAALGFGPPRPGRELGTHFARAACMEASSVEAFRMLRDELVAYGAPRRLVKAAERAIRDEQRHVRQTSALARRFGEEPIAPVPPPPRRLRSLEAMALDNASEGCVRETYSALECAWQAEVAGDPVVRATMRRIARDEMRHLALSWAVHRWVTGKLGAQARARLAAAQRDELVSLRKELTCDPHESLVTTGGLPRSRQSGALLDAIAVRAAA
jgi:hypothetical protein